MKPERLDHFMARANAAYYARENPFRDFTTSPEIFQGFGEILGAWAAMVWHSMGRPTPFILAEAGPGQGTLMADALRLLARVAPDCHAAHRLHFIETSPRLRAIQATKLPHATWHDRIEDVPPAPFILLANEFLDALPIRQFIRQDGQWLERHVQNGQFTDLPAPAPLPSRPALTRPSTHQRLPNGSTLEINEPAEALTTHLAHRLQTHQGAALFIDYGPEKSAPGDSLQALRHGQPTNPLDKPGTADLTAHVDFAALAATARAAGATVHGPTTQGRFLTALGLPARAQALARTRPPREAAALIQAARRLTAPEAMGTLFKVLALCHPALPPPPGFEA